MNGFEPTPPSTPPAAGPASPSPRRSPAGPLIGAIIVVFLLVLGALDYWGAQLAKREEARSAEEIGTLPDPARDAIEVQGTSDEVGAIEEDLSATDLSGLDAELLEIDAELGI